MRIKCNLCLGENVEAHSNSHYLSDFIIRTALNENGTSRRDMGFYFGFDSNRPFSEFKYQRGFTKFDKVVEVLGRESTDEEIELMKEKVEFSSNDKFCLDCEDRFTKIENEFVEKILPKLRNSDLTNLNILELNEEDSKILRLFILLNFFRTSICDNEFDIENGLKEFLRNKIYNSDYEDLENIPLSISYLETLPNPDDTDDSYKTANIVGIVYGANPKIIFFNDFVIMLIDGLDFEYTSYNIFDVEDDFVESFNLDEKKYKVKIFSNDERKEKVNRIATIFSKKLYSEQIKDFYIRYVNEFNKLPTNNIIYGFVGLLANKSKFGLVEQNRDKLINDYLKKLKKPR